MRVLPIAALLIACAGARAVDPEVSAVRQSLHTYALAHEVLGECDAGELDDARFSTHEDQVRDLLLDDRAPDCGRPPKSLRWWRHAGEPRAFHARQ